MITLRPEYEIEQVTDSEFEQVKFNLLAELKNRKYRVLTSDAGEIVFDNGPTLALRGNWEPVQLSGGVFHIVRTGKTVTIKLNYCISLWWPATMMAVFSLIAIFQEIAVLFLVVFIALAMWFQHHRERNEAEELLNAAGKH